ncbi:hypothetical protein SNEBB_008855 [Seison nebaliae]|nr:hypothetical protein SNEBB_008855 [Seison nebaliae]
MLTVVDHGSCDICLTTTIFQILMYSPSFLVNVYKNNYISGDICKTLEDIEFKDKMSAQLPNFIVRNYLVHEILSFKKFPAEDENKKGLACFDHELRFMEGRQRNTATDIIHNFYKLIMLRKDEYPFLPFSVEFVSDEPIKDSHIQSKRRMNFKTPKFLSDLMCVKASQRPTIIKPTMFNVSEPFLNEFLRKNEFIKSTFNIISLLFYTKNADYKLGNITYILHNNGSKVNLYVIEHLPQISLTQSHNFFYAFFTYDNCAQFFKYFNPFDSITEKTLFSIPFQNSKLIVPSFQHIMDAVPYFKFKFSLTHFLNTFGLPNMLIFDIRYHYSSKEHIQLKLFPNDLLKIRQFLKDSLSSINTKNVRLDLYKNFKELRPLTYKRILLHLGEEFWCNDLPCTQELFRNFEVHKTHTRYICIGIIMEVNRYTYTFNDLMASDSTVNEIRKTGQFKNRMEELYNVFHGIYKDEYYHFTNSDSYEMFDKFSKDLARSIALNETIFNDMQMKMWKNQVTFRKNLVNIKLNNPNFIAIVRSFKNKWYCINQNIVAEINHIQKQLIISYGELYPYSVVWEYERNYESSIKLLDKIITKSKYS